MVAASEATRKEGLAGIEAPALTVRRFVAPFGHTGPQLTNRSRDRSLVMRGNLIIDMASAVDTLQYRSLTNALLVHSYRQHYEQQVLTVTLAGTRINEFTAVLSCQPDPQSSPNSNLWRRETTRSARSGLLKAIYTVTLSVKWLID